MKRLWVRRGLIILLGAAGGFAYYALVGCRTGTCPITSSPFASTAYGALIGMIISLDSWKKNS